MDIRKEILAAEWQLKDVGMSVRQFCLKAKIHPETWRLWREGSLPQLRKWMQVQAALDRFVRQKPGHPRKRPAA